MTALILNEKIEQATSILKELHIDAWLTFVRETSSMGDPVLPLILGQPLTWQSALIITAGGDRVAIVGKYDDEAVRSSGSWVNTIPYVEGIRTPLVDTLKRLDPGSIAINFSRDDVTADGLSHGMFLLLGDYLASTPYIDRLVGSDRLVGALRGRKTPGEIDRIRRAIATTNEIFVAVTRWTKPGATEKDVAQFIKGQTLQRSLGFAWEPAMCPIVNTGPNSMIGHGIPSDLAIEPGHVLHIDFGVLQDEYCSDLQRCWYVPKQGETAPSQAVGRAFDTVVNAIQSAAKALRPGAAGWEVDQVARQVIVNAGYPEYQHATGHHVGRSAHDGGGVLGPRWERYGKSPFVPIEENNVLTIELGIENVDGCGYIGLEEMVLVTADGCEFLSTPQTTLPLLQ